MTLNRFIYLGHTISNDLPYRSDDDDIQTTIRIHYAKTSMLWQHFYYCSADVKAKM